MSEEANKSKSGGETCPKNGSDSSEGLPRSKWDWTRSHDDRLLNLLETGYKSDLILDLRPEGLRLPVHKIFLEAGSAVLDGKITAETEEIIIEKVDTRVFKMLLKYLYTGKSGVEMGDALQLMQLATEYEVNGLRDECAEILEGDLTLENVLALFQSGMEFAHGDFIQSTLEFICDNARKLLKSDEFSKLRQECLIEIIQQDSLLVINEMEVFEAVNRWGIAECVRQNLDPQNAEYLRKCLAKPLRHIRFSLMDPAEFALNVTTKKLLSMEESMELLNCFLIPSARRNMLPPGTFMSTPRTYLDKDIVLTRAFSEAARVIQNIEIAGNPNGSETIMIYAKQHVALKSISIPKGIFDDNTVNLFYYDLIKCTLKFAHERVNVNFVTQFDTYERGDVYLRISLNPALTINSTDGWAKVKITFSGEVGYHALSQTVADKQTMDIKQHLFPANRYNRVVANYIDLFNDPAKKHTNGIYISRFKGDPLGVNYGFIEKLEFEVV